MKICDNLQLRFYEPKFGKYATQIFFLTFHRRDFAVTIDAAWGLIIHCIISWRIDLF